jgi:hypothetical protein
MMIGSPVGAAGVCAPTLAEPANAPKARRKANKVTKCRLGSIADPPETKRTNCRETAYAYTGPPSPCQWPSSASSPPEMLGMTKAGSLRSNALTPSPSPNAGRGEFSRPLRELVELERSLAHRCLASFITEPTRSPLPALGEGLGVRAFERSEPWSVFALFYALLARSLAR